MHRFWDDSHERELVRTIYIEDVLGPLRFWYGSLTPATAKYVIPTRVRTNTDL